MKKRLKITGLIFLIFVSFFFLFGCQSTDKKESYFNSGNIAQATFRYDNINDKTFVTFNAAIRNDTIYNINTFSIVLQLYQNSTEIGKQTVEYNSKVRNGADYTRTFSFEADKKIDKIEFVSWNAEYDSFWNTYKIWILASSIVCAVSALIYIIIMVIQDLEFNDIIFFLQDTQIFMYLIIGGIIFGGSIVGFIFSHWVSVLIIVGAIFAFILIVLLAHLIKYIIEGISYGTLFHRGNSNIYKKDKDKNEEYFDNQTQCVADYVGDEEKLFLFTKEQLKEYCQNNRLVGYSRLNKAEIIDFINSQGTLQNQTENQEKTKQAQKTNAIVELDNLIGLESVKTQIKRIRAVLIKNKDVGEQPNLHMCFYGNPGTGKTIVARLIADIFYEIGVLPTNKLIETDRSGLCGQYIGQTAPLTHKKVKEAMGGVLFIDEAYTLCSESSEDYGKEAIAALLKDMEDYKGKFCVILAGYKKEMEEMLALNPGFDSRINRKIDFPDYSIEEQIQIFTIMMKKKRYEITEEAKMKLREIFVKKSQNKNFSNARTVRNVIDELIELQAVRTIENDSSANNSDRIIALEDVEKYMQTI